MAKNDDKNKGVAVADKPAEFPDDAAQAPSPMEQAATDTGLAIRGGSVELTTAPTEFSEALDEVDPQAIKTETKDMVGRDIVIFAWATHEGNEKYRDENGELRDYAVIGFYFADDDKRVARFVTTGGARIVPTVEAAILKGIKPPVRTKLLSYLAKRGTGYRFARKGE